MKQLAKGQHPLKAKDCDGFQNRGKFFEGIHDWKRYVGSGTYLIVLDSPFQRLSGSSDILYIGSTENLGGNENSRLRSYNYPSPRSPEERVNEQINKLLDRGNTVFFCLCQSSPMGMSAPEHEEHLLKRFREEHWELPPWNSSIPQTRDRDS
jgi:hypothetical protein